ncbi:MAG: fumarylacetoacetate hydrolase family protein [Actinobacteria bacterium]|nr:fumarylacetoacetate hydrolase family protein [Actinomycetota bacterium]
MRLVTFETDGPDGPEQRTGALVEGGVLDLAAAAEVPADMLALLEAGAPALAAAREAVAAGTGPIVPAGEYRLAPPLPRPNSLRDFMVVEEHVMNSFKKVPDEWFNLPVYYAGNVDEIYGPDDVVPWPGYSDKLDYELELCAVVGMAGRRIPVERAAEHIAGYTLYNDWSARDIQEREMSVGIGPAMGKHFASSIGPCIATDIDHDQIVLAATIDGEEWSRGAIGDMHFSFEQIISWVSQEQTLYPGDLLGSGTMGRGCGYELDRWIAPGSVVELSADGIGTLRNQVGEKGAGARRVTEPARQVA